jgi:hypothetical protein
MIHPPQFSALAAAETPNSGEKQGEKWQLNFAYEYLYHTSMDLLTSRKILRHGTDGFTYPPKEVVLRIFIALKIPSLSARFETSNVGFNGKHDNHYTPEND